jgi:hypothetical protein
VSTSVVKWSEGVSNRVSIIIKRYVDHRRFAAVWLFCLSHFYHILSGLFCVVYMVVCFVCLCLILYKYLLCIIIVTYVFVVGILFHCVLLCII